MAEKALGPKSAPRLRVPDRAVLLPAACLDELLPHDDLARLVWHLVEPLGLSAWYQDLKAVDGVPGRRHQEQRRSQNADNQPRSDGEERGPKPASRLHLPAAYPKTVRLGVADYFSPAMTHECGIQANLAAWETS